MGWSEMQFFMTKFFFFFLRLFGFLRLTRFYFVVSQVLSHQKKEIFLTENIKDFENFKFHR